MCVCVCVCVCAFSSLIFWQVGLLQVLESFWVFFPIPWCAQVLWDSIFTLLALLLDPSKTCHLSLLLFVSFMSSWSSLWWISTAPQHALNCSTFCLVWVVGRSSMNCMVRIPGGLQYNSLPLSSFSFLSVTLLCGLVHHQWHWAPC